MEEWRNGKVEERGNGKMEERGNGKMERWKGGGMFIRNLIAKGVRMDV